ncbi:MAG: glutaredoxin [Candidatus Magasanikbacteria bacterium CG11_big_fil_rev_8_21_14_0_20_39_34]|uniref:Glutaredoxin n=1 Tax=Candidatus Magasanikbacteria bacterium CG11_big_fil_rev_8_21_14_0_20_39_34 TaxID=1974653 RepID=A0A2H0N8F6_9BACT|nr:MAG: glutaredoxin [Candidatus Magasanikbacteria bacterium CG11_big_fil_rev_8_21_14_0_20_39_34]
MKQVKVYTTTYCPYCKKAKELLKALHVPFEEVDVEQDTQLRDELIERYQWQTVPLITFDEELIGGFDDLNRLHSEGKLMEKLGE